MRQGSMASALKSSSYMCSDICHICSNNTSVRFAAECRLQHTVFVAHCWCTEGPLGRQDSTEAYYTLSGHALSLDSSIAADTPVIEEHFLLLAKRALGSTITCKDLWKTSATVDKEQQHILQQSLHRRHQIQVKVECLAGV